MSVEDVRAHAKQFSESVKRGWSSPWDSNFEEMAKKTVLKKVLKYAPLSTEVASKISMDETVHDTISSNMTEEQISYTNIDAETGEVLNNEEEQV
jgi:recombination protein RecT